ncbi:aromatic amino acid lyase [Elusimicrobiota bacterium]
MLALDPNKPFNLREFWRIAVRSEKIRATKRAVSGLAKASKHLDRILRESKVLIYGIHTGFGVLQEDKRRSQGWEQSQRELVESHACGVGENLKDMEVRGAMYLRVLTLLKGRSGISLKTFNELIKHINSRKIAKVPSQGSVGACGDLIPLAHIAKTIFSGIPRGRMGPRDGLALINGTEVSNSVALLAAMQTRQILDWAQKISALSLFAVKGKSEAWDPDLIKLKKHPGAIRVSENLAHYLGSFQNTGLPQDPYSFRAWPHILGVSLELFEESFAKLKREADSLKDNPVFLFGPKTNILHGAHFHGIGVACAADVTSLALALMGLASERRVNFMLKGERGLPKMLKEGNVSSGLMMAHVTQAALASENKFLAHPASADSIPTNIGQEDVVPMAMHAALKLKKSAQNSARILAVEALACQRAIGLSGKCAQLAKHKKLLDIYKDISQTAGCEKGYKDISGILERLAKKFIDLNNYFRYT